MHSTETFKSLGGFAPTYYYPPNAWPNNVPKFSLPESSCKLAYGLVFSKNFSNISSGLPAKWYPPLNSFKK